MKTTDQEVTKPSPPKYQFVGLVFFWTTAIAVLFSWDFWETYVNIVENARLAAIENYNNIVLFRRWAAMHGGVYVSITPETPPNPYLSNVPERDINTPSSRKLTLVNPAYMTRQLNELRNGEYKSIGHITSLKLLRHENAPDDWERSALLSFERGEKEASSITVLGGETYFRFMRPLMAEKECLTCHASQGYKVGDIRGGISFSIPWAPYGKQIQSQATNDVAAYGGIWAIGMLGLLVWKRRYNQHLSGRKQAEDALEEQRVQLADIISFLPDATLAIDSERRVIIWNKAIEKMTGIPAAEMLGKGDHVCSIPFYGEARPHLADLVFLGSREIAARYPTISREGDSITAESYCNALYNNKGAWVFAKASPLHDHAGKVIGAIEIIRDITGRKQAEKGLQLAASVFTHASEAIVITDPDGAIIEVNDLFTTITGYSREEAIGQNPRILKSDRHDNEFYALMWSSLTENGNWHGEIWNRRKNGEVYAEMLTISAVRDAEGDTQHYVALFFDITDKKKSEELIWQQANFDMLTGLPNRRMVFDRLEQEIKVSNREDVPLALLFIDLDRFKEVNDSLGHEAGDALLKEAAQRMVSCVRESDTVGRMGGDEFIIILDNLEDTSSVGSIANKLLLKLAAPFRLEGEMAYISASIGITVYPVDAKDVAALLKNADQAMYQAKRQGRNRFHFYTSAMQEIADARIRVTNNLHAAIQKNQFLVYYQPIVKLSTGAIQKAEALIRWQHPALGLISPADFIPLAEETGMIHEIGDWVFRQAAAYAVYLRGTGYPEFQISVNKSPLEFKRHSDTHAPWFDHLKQIGLPAQGIVIEITEGLLMEAKTETRNMLLAFRDHGMQIALDDFGTGYSSLSYLKTLDIDYIKIDQSFTRNLAPGAADFTLCEAMVVMAHKLGLKVIAEGVETEQQCDLLQEIGCDYGQGYLFSRPAPAEEFEKVLANGNWRSKRGLSPADLRPEPDA